MTREEALNKLPYVYDYAHGSQREWLIDSLEQLGLIEIEKPISPISKADRLKEFLYKDCGYSTSAYIRIVNGVLNIYGND